MDRRIRSGLQRKNGLTIDIPVVKPWDFFRWMAIETELSSASLRDWNNGIMVLPPESGQFVL